MTSIEKFNSLLKLAVQHGASDIHLKINRNPIFRIDGKLKEVETRPLTTDQLLEILATIIPDQFKARWTENFQIDFSHLAEGIGRFRMNAFYQRGLPGIVIRHIKDKIPDFKKLNLDGEAYQKICDSNNGIALICGATGSGKSTTLAAMLNYINQYKGKHIVTLEDPIEYTYKDEKSLITQREVGIDTPSFEMGITAAMRQDPDVILIGEMRDAATFTTALKAAETGHLVLGTLHASTSQQAVQRLFEFYSVSERDVIRPQIASSLRATVTQQLLPSVDGGRVPVNEIFWVDPVAKQLVENGEFEKIGRFLDTQEESLSRSFNKDLVRLVHEGKIAKSDAIAASPSPQKLEMNLKGIYLSSGGLVD